MASENSEKNDENIQMDSYTKDPEALDDVSNIDSAQVKFLPKSDEKVDKGNDDLFSSPKIEFAGMTKEELMKYDKDPFWRKVRLFLFILFWVVWISMLVAVVVIIVVSPKCPFRPAQSFWEKDATYKIELKAFRGIGKVKNGNFKGVESKLDYLKTLGFKNILLSSFLQVDAATKAFNDHKAIDSIYGNMDDLKSLIKVARKKEMKILMDIDLVQTSANHPWFKDKSLYLCKKVQPSEWHARDGNPGFTGSPGEYCYGAPVSYQPSLNFGNEAVVTKVLDVLRYWLDLGISGFCLENVAFIMGARTNYGKLEDQATGENPIPGNSILSNWYKYKRNDAQLFQNESYTFVNKVRALLDEVAKKTDKPRALFVDPGNLGYDPPLNKLVAYYGKKNDGAHVVINQRMAEINSTNNNKALSQLINETSNAFGKKVTAYLTAGCYLKRTTQIPRLAAALLLPGAPSLYYGQELGMSTFTADYNTNSVLSKNANSAKYNKDNEDAYNSVPMQWTKNSVNFGVLDNETTVLDWFKVISNSRKMNAKKNNYRTLSSYGHPISTLNVVKDILKLRASSEAFQFGDLTLAKSLVTEKFLLMFARSAAGFKSFVVVANIDNKNSYTKDLTFATDGKSAVTGTVKYIYNGGTQETSYKIGMEASLKNVYVPKGPSVLVFQY